MNYRALASDYDGTLATDGRVDDTTLAALHRLKASGRKFLLVTGRQLEDLGQVFPHWDLCDCIVAENGALLYFPTTQEVQLLGDRPSELLVQQLRDRGVEQLGVGQVIVATWTPHENTVLQTIRDLGLDLQVILNKDAVMVLPLGIDKAAGLTAACDRLGLSPQQVVAVGDAENDQAMLDLCAVAVAVANALSIVKERCNWVTTNSRGAGVVELIDELVTADLANWLPGLPVRAIAREEKAG